MTSRRMDAITTHFFSQLDAAITRLQAEGKDVIRLDIGSPDLPPHAAVIDALYRSAAADNAHGYQSHLGPFAYREAWCAMYAGLFGVQLDPESEIIPLIGAKEGIFHLSQALVNPGDTVLIPNPHYPTYLKGTLFAGGEPFFLPLTSEHSYLPDLDAVPNEVARRAKLMWINYPNNPTGSAATLDFYQQLIAFGHKHEIIICADAAYSQVFYNGVQPPSILQVPGAKEIAVEFNSLSKSHNMAGWRVGALAGSGDILQTYLTLKTNADSGQFLPVIEAATTALSVDPEWIVGRNEVYRQRRDLVIEALDQLGLPVTPPSAALYVWCPIPKGWSSTEFSLALLEETGVSVAPGPVFGSLGEGFIRISISQPDERLQEGMHRLTHWWRRAALKK